ncbi:MAG: hypothetical protein WC386_00625 [Candidatus Paceibacterota bacterium]
MVEINAVEKVRFFIENVDSNPRFPVFVVALPNPTFNVVVQTVDHDSQGYYINHLLADRESAVFPEEEAFFSAVSAVRIRTQKQNPNLELFPDVDVKNVKSLRKIVEASLNSNEPLEAIDCRIMSGLAYSTWRAGGKNSLPLIKSIVPLNASDVISVAERLSIKL